MDINIMERSIFKNKTINMFLEIRFSILILGIESKKINQQLLFELNPIKIK